MAIIRWQRPELSGRSALGRLFSLRDELERAFDSKWPELARATQFLNAWVPPVDVSEGNETVVVKAELPGMRKEDIQVTLHDGLLSISGERKDEVTRKEGETHRSERFFGRFQRSITLTTPVNADKIEASYKDGILTVTLPKTEEAKPRQIEVNLGK